MPHRSCAAVSLSMAVQFLRCRGRSLWLQRCVFWTVKESFPLTTAAQNIPVFLRKSPLLKEHFFEWLKTAISSNACGTSTLKSLLPQGGLCPSRSPMTAKAPLKVHLRLRFQNLRKPRTAGLCGRAADACDCGPLSCYIFERGYHPTKHLQNRYQRSQER